MYYRHNDNYAIIEKSEVPLEGDNVITFHGDLDIELYDVIVGFISPNGEMLYHTKLLRSVDNIVQRLSFTKEELTSVKGTLDEVLTELIPSILELFE